MDDALFEAKIKAAIDVLREIRSVITDCECPSNPAHTGVTIGGSTDDQEEDNRNHHTGQCSGGQRAAAVSPEADLEGKEGSLGSFRWANRGDPRLWPGLCEVSLRRFGNSASTSVRGLRAALPDHKLAENLSSTLEVQP